MIFSLLIKAIPIVFIISFIQQNYPDQFNQFLITLSYNAIYIYSKLQIFIGKYVKQLKQFIDSNPEVKKFVDKFFTMMKKRDEIEYIKDGKVISTCYLDTQHTAPQNFHFMIISYYNNANNSMYSNKKIEYSLLDSNTDYEISNIQFFLVEAIIGNERYKIDLKNENYNFYIIDNIFDRQFFIFYLLNYYKESTITIEQIESKLSENNCFIKIVDNEVNILQLNLSDKNDNIQIKKDKYIRRV